MGLLVVGSFFFIVLIFLTWYFLVSEHPASRFFNKIAVPSLCSSFCLLCTIIFIFLQLPLCQNISFFLAMVSLLVVTHNITAFSFTFFSKDDPVLLKISNFIFHLIGFFLLCTVVGKFQWDELSGFKFYSETLFAGTTQSGIKLLTSVYFIGTPFLAGCTLIGNIFGLKTNIQRQQALFFGITLFLLGGFWLSIILLYDVFSWVFALFPIGLILVLGFFAIIISLKAVFDIKQMRFVFLRFIFSTFIISLVAALISTGIIYTFRSLSVQIVLVLFVSVSLFSCQNFFATKVTSFFGIIDKYERNMTNELDALDYTLGRTSVLNQFITILKKYLRFTNTTILIAGSGTLLEVVYSDTESSYLGDTKQNCFVTLLKKDIVIVSKNEVILNYEYEKVRNELLEFFEKTSSEVLILIREGVRLIGVVGFSEKSHSMEYTTYDYEVINNLSSHFFMLAYYVRNIAKQNIIMTVDREIEMSDQIIGSIQENMDKIENKALSVDSVSYSAHQLGGDFIDFIKLTEDRHMFLIGDIAGKGLSASMSMVILKSVIHTFLKESSDFKKLIIKVNAFIKQNLPRGTFFAGLFGIIDFKTNTIYYINGGIPLMSMYIDTYQNVLEVQGEGKVLGFVNDIEPFLKIRKITMNHGDILVLTTDGLLEARNLSGSRFGSDRVNRIVQKNKTSSVTHLAHIIYNSLLDFISREIEDDITVLIFKYDKE